MRSLEPEENILEKTKMTNKLSSREKRTIENNVI